MWRGGPAPPCTRELLPFKRPCPTRRTVMGVMSSWRKADVTAAGTGVPPAGCHEREKEFREPVALSSAEPADFPLPRTALELGFDLIALRAPCRRERSGGTSLRQVAGRAEACNLRELSFGPFCLRRVQYDRSRCTSACR